MGKGSRKYWKQTRVFLGGVRFRNILVFLFFLVVSASFWLMQTLNESLRVDVDVPLQLRNVPAAVVITTELPSEITVSLRDRGTSLVRFLRHKGLSPVVLDFAKYDRGAESGHVQFQQAEIVRLLQLQLESTTRVEGIAPDTLELYYTRNKSRRLPVEVNGKIAAAPQNYLLGQSCQPDSVEVFAPSQVLDTMQCVYTEKLDLSHLTETVHQNVRLQGQKGMKFDTTQVALTVVVDYYIERSVEVPIIGLNFPPDRQLRVFPSRATITFRVGAVKSNRDWENSFVLAATYEELLSNEDARYKLHLKSVPEDVSNVRIYPPDVDYLIEQVYNPDAAVGKE
ncbi:MAG: CdaR family protein [Bacteroidaceae bacterium]